jgi:hypothetical protein
MGVAWKNSIADQRWEICCLHLVCWRVIEFPVTKNAEVNEVDDVAYILFVGKARETFFRERNDRTQVLGKLPELLLLVQVL